MDAQEKEKTIRHVTWVGLFVNFFLTGGKFLFGWLFFSQALIADAVHSLSDMATDLAVLIGVRFWSAPPDEGHPYGHGRIETIITVVIGTVLAMAGISIVWEALSTMHGDDSRAPGLPALIVALISIFLKEWLYRWTIRRGRAIRSSAVEANAWHHRSDAISSIPAAIAIGISYFIPNCAFVDKVGAVIVATFIIHAAWKIIREPLFELSDAGRPDEIAAIEKLALSVPGAVFVHAIRTRSSGGSLLVDLRLHVLPTLTVREGHDISTRLRDTLMKSNLHIQDVVVHIEPAGEDFTGVQPLPPAGAGPAVRS